MNMHYLPKNIDHTLSYFSNISSNQIISNKHVVAILGTTFRNQLTIL